MKLGTIKIKIISVVIILSLGIISTAVLGTVMVLNMAGAMGHIVDQKVPDFSELHSASIDMFQVVMAEEGMLSSVPGSRQFEQCSQDYDKNIGQMTERFDHFENNQPDDRFDLLIATFRRLSNQWLTSSQAAVEIAKNGTDEERSKALEESLSMNRRRFDEAEEALDGIIESLQNDLIDIREQSKSQMKQRMILMPLLYTLILAAGIAVSIILFNPLLKRLKHFQVSFSAITKGGSDLSKRLEITGKDEITYLSRLFNEFSGDLHRIMTKLHELVDAGSGMKHSLVNQATEAAAAMNEMSANISSIGREMESLDQQVTLGQTGSQQALAQMKILRSRMTDQTAAMVSISRSTMSITSSMAQMEQRSAENNRSIDQLVLSAGDGRIQLDATGKAIEKVTRSVDQISGMVEIINGIADQTNLLAMNAAIEAAHAGESGKGFAVVANEIRKLANNSSDNARKISGSIGDIVKTIQVSAESSTQLHGSFDTIQQEIGDLQIGVQEIMRASSSLASESVEIKQSVNEASQINEDVQKIAGELETVQDGHHQQFSSFAHLSTEVKEGTEQIDIGVREIANSSEELSHIAGELGSLISNLKEIIIRFADEEK